MADVMQKLAERLTVYPARVSPTACDTYFTCPRRFLFSKRLRLRPHYERVSLSRSRGSYFHLFMQRDPSGVQEVEATHRQNQKDIARQIDKTGDLDGRLAKDLDDDRIAYDMARVMADIVWESYPLPDTAKVIGRELSIEADAGCIPLKGILDLLISYDSGIYVLDYKTTSFDPAVAIAGYPYGYAHWIYRLLANRWLADNDYGSRVKGLQLNCVQAPSIKFCGKDRDFTVVRVQKKSGPNKGQWYDKKTYHGAPRWDIYVKRCQEWYTENEIRPVAQLTRYYPPNPNERPPLDVQYAILHVARAATCPDPLTEDFDLVFPRRHRSCTDPYGRPCDYCNLCACSPNAWPSVIETEYRTPEGSTEPKGDTNDANGS